MRMRLAWTPGLVAVLVIALVASPSRAAQPPQTDSTPLTRLASSKFPNLTHAERALLTFVDVSNVDHGEFAVAGSTSTINDPSNEPAHADRWDRGRDVRASLVKWLCEDPDALRMASPEGIRILGARVVDGLDLSHLRVPFSDCDAPLLDRGANHACRYRYPAS